MTVVQAKTQFEIAASQIPAIKSQIAQTENALSVLLGDNPKEIPRGKSIREFKLPPVPAELPSELLCQLSDIIQAEQELIAANAQIGAAKALHFPSLSLTGYSGGLVKTCISSLPVRQKFGILLVLSQGRFLLQGLSMGSYFKLKHNKKLRY